MGVTFGTPASNAGNSTSPSVTLTGLTPGQPVKLFISNDAVGGSLLFPSAVVDTNGMTWTLVAGSNDAGDNTCYIGGYIGTGGNGGTSTTISATYSGACPWTVQAVGCIGASTAAGMAAVDSAAGNETGVGTGVFGPAITPAALGEGAAFACRSSVAIATAPTSPWTSTTNGQASMSTYPSPPESSLVPSWGTSTSGTWVSVGIVVKLDIVQATGGMVATFSASITAGISKLIDTGGMQTTFTAAIATNSGFAPANLVPWQLPVAINDHAYMMDFTKSRITTMQIRRQSADDSVEPGEQTLSAQGVWPRAQDNYFLGAGQKFLDNRFAFESVYVHSGEYPSVRTRFWKSQGVNPWAEGQMTLHNEYASIASSTANLLIVACGNYLYKTDGAAVAFTDPAASDETWTLGGAVGGNELTANQSSLESNVTTGWTGGTNTTIAASSVWAQDGSYSLAMTATAAGTVAAETIIGTGGVPCTPGEVVRALASFHSPTTARACTVQVQFFTSAGALLTSPTSTSVNSTLSGNGGEASMTYTAPAGAAFMSLIVVGAGLSASEILYADCMLLGTIWSPVASANTHNIVSITSDGSRVWFACGVDGVFVTVAGTTTSAAAATPAALRNPAGIIATSAGAGTVGASMPSGSTTYYVSKLDAFGNETIAEPVVITVGTTPVNLTWNPDTTASNFNVYRGTNTLIYTGDVPSFVDDGTVVGTSRAYPAANGTGSTPYKATFILYGKGHLVASTGRDLVEILASGNITFIFQHENPSFVFNCGIEVPSAILVAGNAGGTNGGVAFIGALQPDTANNGATLAPPTWASALPYGETINAIAYNAGSILLGTSLGVRTGTDANNAGIFNVNPVIEDPGAVLCTAAWAQYQWFGWSNYNPSENWAARSTVAGLGRADLSQYTTPGVPAYATDVMSTAAGTTTQVVVIAGNPYFVTLNSGTYNLWGWDNKVVSTGWFEPGWVRYGTLENKIIVEVDFQHEPLPAGASVSYEIVYEDTTTVDQIASNSVAGSTTLIIPENAGLATGDRFMPVITLCAATGQASGPIFLSHITKSMVTTKRSDEFLLALQLFDEVQTLGPSNKTQYMVVMNEYLYLKGLEATGQVVTLQLGDFVYSAYVDQIMEEMEDMTKDRSWFQGTCTVKLISLSPTVAPGT